jgi:hypothetical protein
LNDRKFRRQGPESPKVSYGAELNWYIDRNASGFFIAVLAVLIADASGVSSLLVPEACPIDTTESAPTRRTARHDRCS